MITPAIYKCPSCGWHGNNPDLLNELGWTCASCKRTYAFTIADPTIPAYLAGETSRAEETPRCPACDDTTVCGHDYHWGSVNAEIAALRQQVKDLQGELYAIDAILARRPALDLPTRWENIEKAISYAKRTDQAERTAQALREALEKIGPVADNPAKVRMIVRAALTAPSSTKKE